MRVFAGTSGFSAVPPLGAPRVPAAQLTPPAFGQRSDGDGGDGFKAVAFLLALLSAGFAGGWVAKGTVQKDACEKPAGIERSVEQR